MNIMIVGCGSVGRTLAKELNEEGNNITLVDTDEKKLAAFSAGADIMAIPGNGATHEVQKKAGIDKMDLMIAVTGSDELNLLCCVVAKMSGHCQTIARVKKPEYSEDSAYLKDELGLAMVINPERAAADEIVRILQFPSAIRIDTFADGKVELMKFRLPENCPLVGKKVRQVASSLPGDVLFCSVERENEAFIVNGDFTFAERDIVSLIASPKNAADFFTQIGYKTHAVRDVMLIGGTELCEYLTERLLSRGVKVRIIEKNPEICEKLCIRFPGATVIHGDAAKQETLVEEGVETTGAFVALTTKDEENILLSLYARTAGAGKIVTKINRTEFDSVTRHLELDSAVYPKNVTADIIVRYVRSMKKSIGSNVENFYNVIQDEVEAAEFSISEPSAVTDTPLSSLRLRRGVLVASILRGNNVIIPHGNDKILPGDHVVIVSGAFGLHNITDILA